MKASLIRGDKPFERVEILGFALDRHECPKAVIHIEGQDPLVLHLIHWSWLLPDDPQEVAEVLHRLTPQSEESSSTVAEFLSYFEDLKKRA